MGEVDELSIPIGLLDGVADVPMLLSIEPAGDGPLDSAGVCGADDSGEGLMVILGKMWMVWVPALLVTPAGEEPLRH